MAPRVQAEVRSLMPYGSYGEVRVYESPSGLTTLGPRKACDAFSGGPGDTRGAFRGLNVDLGHDTVFDRKKNHLANCQKRHKKMKSFIPATCI